MVTSLSADVRASFPYASGFSPRNPRFMKSFAQEWPDFPMLHQPVATLPWGHNVILVDKLGDAETRLWYARSAVDNGAPGMFCLITLRPDSTSARVMPSPTLRRLCRQLSRT
ncbi:MAG: DUF1016 N-terminal domain-containing protein [Arthrobacter sp.]|uniref:DUF1016 N-terminal domain-containing protein n=1 Tax=unclassified Arthrobacter TaxID=235627 RepID=UPI001CFF7161|nr:MULTISPECIES: DUF1016 N-terminal domain-containing protein [unclassified Arthrobacter]WGZ78116.1 DUF1016 N-terminal domain-containing protein [Arthrobacter sp. EM1]